MLEAEARKLDVRQRDFLGHRGMMGSKSAGAVSSLHWLVWRLVVSEAAMAGPLHPILQAEGSPRKNAKQKSEVTAAAKGGFPCRECMFGA